MSTAATAPRMTAEEYLVWERNQLDKHDFYDGELIAMAGASMRHAALTSALTIELGAALRGGPCRVYSSDLKISAMAGRRYFYPDASVVCARPRGEPAATDVIVNPNAIIEVLSASTEAYDRGAKWTSYQRLESLTDYLLVSQSSARIEHFVRQGPAEVWRYRGWGPGERAVLANGASFEIDAVYAGVFELEGDPEIGA